VRLRTYPRGVAPQQRNVVKPDDVERIQRAAELKALAELELVDAVLSAMRHGASIRETAAVSGLSERTIIRWRSGQGLPTHEDWAAPARERRERLYEALPWLRETQELLHQLKAEQPPG